MTLLSGEGERSPSTALSTEVIPTEPVKVKVGEKYKFLVQGAISNVKIEKIYQNQANQVFLVLTVDVPEKWRTTTTQTLTLSEFKLRLLVGGITEIVL